MEFTRIPILNVVAATRAGCTIVPCLLDEVQQVIRFALSIDTSPMAPGFLVNRAATGLIVVEQHPTLASFRFLENEHDPGVIGSHLHQQCTRLDIPLDIELTTPSEQSITSARQRAKPIVQMTVEKLCGFTR